MTKTTPTPITDFHAHIFARPFFDALASQSPLKGTIEQKLKSVVDKIGIELPEPGIDTHLQRWIQQLDQHGVSRMAAFASAPEEIPAIGEMAMRSKGRLVPIAVCNPAAPGAAERLRPLLEERGFRGVLLFPAMHHYHLSDEALRPVLDLLEEHEAIVYVHCGILVIKLRDLLGLPRPYDLRYANPLEVIPAACAYPGLTFCIPHFGAGFFRETLIAGAQCSNIVTDTSSTNGWVRTQPDHPSLKSVLERTLDVFGVDRVAFGTDSNVFPKGWRSDRLEEWRNVASELSLSESECVQLFHGTADRLLGKTKSPQHAS